VSWLEEAWPVEPPRRFRCPQCGAENLTTDDVDMLSGRHLRATWASPLCGPVELIREEPMIGSCAND
jgi:predicted RNA-binding Zn-ribbon protein involved in translation (DUF1610 family)